MKNNTEIMIVNENNLKDKIYIIRGQKVMLDRDLAEIYGYTTKRFNEQVKNKYWKKKPKLLFINYILLINQTKIK